MLWNRGNNKLSKLGYRSIFWALEFLLYNDTYEQMENYYTKTFKNPKQLFEERINVSEESITGICLKYVADPINCLRMMPIPTPPEQQARTVDASSLLLYMRRPYEMANADGNAVRGGHLECLKYLVENGSRILVREVCLEAVKHNNFDILKYLRYKGCPWDVKECFFAAGKHENPEMLDYIYENRGECSVFLAEECAKKGCTYALQFLRNTNFGWKWEKSISSSAANGGNLDCLRYLIENGCEYDEDDIIFYAASGSGNIECIKYLLGKGCKMDKDTCAIAAKRGNLSCLRYLRENGCEWNEKTFRFAGDSGKIEVLRYVHESGCKIPSDLSSSNPECKNYIRNVILKDGQEGMRVINRQQDVRELANGRHIEPETGEAQYGFGFVDRLDFGANSGMQCHYSPQNQQDDEDYDVRENRQQDNFRFEDDGAPPGCSVPQHLLLDEPVQFFHGY